MFKPAIRHLLNATLVSAGRSSSLVTDHFESIYYLLQFAVDSSRLLSNPLKSNFFIEDLYSLERVTTLPTELAREFAPIDRFQRVMTLFYFVVFPRLVRILQEYCQSMPSPDAHNQDADGHGGSSDEGKEEEEQHRPSLWQRTKRLLRYIAHATLYHLGRVLPLCASIEQIITTIFRVLYVLGRSPYYHPVHAILGTRLLKSRFVEHQRHQRERQGQSSTSTTLADTTSAASNSSNWPLKVIFGVLFALRGMDWFVNSASDLQTSEHLSTRLAQVSGASRIPPAPQPSKPSIQAIHNNKGPHPALRPPTDPNICAICQQVRQHSCAASSGYVFCYQCIVAYIQEHQRCPITLLPCRETDLIKLYEAHS